MSYAGMITLKTMLFFIFPVISPDPFFNCCSCWKTWFSWISTSFLFFLFFFWGGGAGDEGGRRDGVIKSIIWYIELW